MTRTFQSIRKNYCRKNHAHDKKEKAVKAQISELEEQLQIMEKRLNALYTERPFWIDEIIKPIAKLLNAKYPDRYFNVLGPFGLQCTTAIHFYRKGVKESEHVENGNCLSINFVLGSLSKGEILVQDVSQNTQEYIPNSIGEVNGMNHPNIAIPPTGDTIEWLNGFVK